MRSSLRGNPWLFAPIVGSAIGFVTLGVGGRIAMRIVAIAQGQPPAWTFEGTLTVLLLGVGIGAAGALIRAATDRWLPARTPLAVRSAVFALACLLLALRGVSPFTGRTLVIFLPVVAAYAAAIELAWRRMHLPSRAGATAALRGADAAA